MAGGAVNQNLDAYDAGYEDVINEIPRGEKFVDSTFPPEKRSLIEPGVNPGSVQWGKIQWVRATDIPELNDEEG